MLASAIGQRQRKQSYDSDNAIRETHPAEEEEESEATLGTAKEATEEIVPGCWYNQFASNLPLHTNSRPAAYHW